MAEYFTINSSWAFKNERAIPYHIFELFGDFGGHVATQVRLLLLKHIARDPGFHMRHGTVCLEMRNISFERWLNRLADEHMYCDKLVLLSLSTMYRRHSMVVTVNKMWSTIEHSSPLNLLELRNECSVKLIYLGQLCFGELKPKPKPSQTLPSLLVQTSANPSTSIANSNIDQSVYRNDESSSSQQVIVDTNSFKPSMSTMRAVSYPAIDQTTSLPVATSPSHVGTAGNVPSVEINIENSVNVETDKGCVPVETPGNDIGTLHVEKSADQPVTLHVHVETASNASKTTECVGPDDIKDTVQKPTKKKQDFTVLLKPAKLILQPLNELEKDVWCNKTSEYHHFLPVQTAWKIQMVTV